MRTLNATTSTTTYLNPDSGFAPAPNTIADQTDIYVGVSVELDPEHVPWHFKHSLFTGAGFNGEPMAGGVDFTDGCGDTIDATHSGLTTVRGAVFGTTVTGGSGSLVFYGNTGAGNYGADSVAGGATAADTIDAAPGGGTYKLGTGGNGLLNGSASTAIVNDQGNGQRLFAEGKGDTVFAGGYNCTVHDASAGNVTLVGGGAPSTIYGAATGGASAAMYAGQGATTFYDDNVTGGGFDIISGFRSGVDQLNFGGNVGGATINGAPVDNEAMTSETYSGGNTTIHTNTNETITLLGIAPSQIGHIVG